MLNSAPILNRDSTNIGTSPYRTVSPNRNFDDNNSRVSSNPAPSPYRLLSPDLSFEEDDSRVNTISVRSYSPFSNGGLPMTLLLSGFTPSTDPVERVPPTYRLLRPNLNFEEDNAKVADQIEASSPNTTSLGAQQQLHQTSAPRPIPGPEHNMPVPSHPPGSTNRRKHGGGPYTRSGSTMAGEQAPSSAEAPSSAQAPLAAPLIERSIELYHHQPNGYSYPVQLGISNYAARPPSTQARSTAQAPLEAPLMERSPALFGGEPGGFGVSNDAVHPYHSRNREDQRMIAALDRHAGIPY